MEQSVNENRIYQFAIPVMFKLFCVEVSNKVPVPEPFGMYPTEVKLKLRDEGFPAFFTRLFVDYCLPKQQKKITGILTSSTLLISVPSTLGENQLTTYFEERLKSEYKCSLLPDTAIWSLHKVEAKATKKLEYRVSNPIHFGINLDLLFEAVSHSREVILLDDIINTGESVINLGKQLTALDIPVTGIVSLLPFSTRYPTQEELDNFLITFAQRLNLTDKEKVDLKPKIDVVFGDYLYKRLKRERDSSIDTPERAKRCYDAIYKADEQLKLLCDRMQEQKKHWVAKNRGNP